MINRALEYIERVEREGFKGISDPLSRNAYTLSNLADGFTPLEYNDQIVEWVLTTSDVYTQLRKDNNFLAFFDVNTQCFLDLGIRGCLWGARLVTVDHLPPGVCYLLSGEALENPIEDAYFQVVVFPPPKSSLNLENFEEVQRDTPWVLLRQPRTGNEKWVSESDICVSGVKVAFYDADPTWIPESKG